MFIWRELKVSQGGGLKFWARGVDFIAWIALGANGNSSKTQVCGITYILCLRQSDEEYSQDIEQ